MFFKNLWLKLTDSNELRAKKFLKIREKAKREYETKFSKEIEEIHRKINNQKKLNFLHSGHAADIVNLLPTSISNMFLSFTFNCIKSISLDTNPFPFSKVSSVLPQGLTIIV